jgi:cold shock CspA family protein
MDSYESKFKEIKADVLGNIDNVLSEEDSKLQIINRVLTEVLCWPHANIACENKHENGFSDYIVKENQMPCFLIEAKRIGKVDVVTAKRNQVRYLKLSGSSLKNCIEGVNQATSYCNTNGLVLSVLTDGITWIIFKTFVLGEPFINKEAIVFPSLEAIESDFSLFYELLSREFINQRLYNVIFDNVHNKRVNLSQEFYSAVPEGEIKLSQKSDIAFDLDKVFEKYLSAMAGNDDEELLIECFVESRESRIADFSLEKMTANVLGNITTDKGVNEQLNTLIESTVSSDDSGKLGADQTVFIVGPTGAGKTTFLDRFFKKTLTRAVKEKCAVININCLDSSGNEETIISWLTDKFISVIERTMYNGSPSWNQLMSLYQGEYLKRAQGVDKYLYESDKGKFKIKFGEFMEELVEKDREGYLIRLLKDLIQNRKILPIFVIDNTDENSITFKQKVFQYLQSIRREVKHSMSIFPVTDKSAWSFSKTDIFGIYDSRSFFLPTPSPREVFRKRAEYLKGKIDVIKKDSARGRYFADKGIQISIDDLDGFTKVLESIFVDHDFTSKTIGQLTNYNIRRTLKLSQRVLTSSIIKIEDLIRSFISEKPVVTRYTKFIDALLKGNYQLHKKGDTPEIIPVYDVDSKVKQSPLLMLRILTLLQTTLNNGRTIDEQHLEVNSIVSYFDALGGSEVATENSLISLLNSSLIEPYDNSINKLSPEQKLAISHKGKAHLDLASKNSVFFYQMALTTYLVDKDIAENIRNIYKTEENFSERISKVKSVFATYLLDEDAKFINNAASGEQFDNQQNLLHEIDKFKLRRKEPVNDLSSTLGEQFTVGYKKENVLVTVEWYDPRKKYGFANVPEHDEGAYINLETLLNAGIGFITEGDSILCDIQRNEKGIQITKIHDIEVDEESIEIHDCKIVRLFPDRYYGFAELVGTKQTAYFQTYSFNDDARKNLCFDYLFKAEVIRDSLSGTYQVRSVKVS